MINTYELHITGSANIITELKTRRLPWLEINMLDKDLKIVQTDYMSAIKIGAKSLEKVKEYASLLIKELEDKGVEIFRIKIEAPPLEEYFKDALYIESHFEVQKDDVTFPLSYIVNKDKHVGTDREYKKELFKEFSLKYAKSEVCLLDNNVQHDVYWLNEWN